MPRYRRYELEDALADSLDEHPDLPAMVPEPLPSLLRRAQGRRRRWAWLRDLSGDALILSALGVLYGVLCYIAAWRLWP